jgi:hypothetical protein
VVHVRVLLVDHIEVRLQHGRRVRLAARRPGFDDDDVAGRVASVFQAAGRCHLQHVITDAVLFLRAAGDGQDAVEMAPQRLWFQ